MIMPPKILHTNQLAKDAVSLIEEEARQAIKARNEFRIALSGGNTPRPIFEKLAKVPLDWSRVVVTFSDERCVGPDDEQSNYFMAHQTLLDHVPIPPQNILRIRGEIDPAEAAREYETALKERSSNGGIYRHDLILLGMGADGHTASLFPGTSALEITDRLVVENYVPKLEAWRITFTYPLIDAAQHVVFLVNSEGKDEMLKQVFSGKSDYPCSRVLPSSGNITWLLGT